MLLEKNVNNPFSAGTAFMLMQRGRIQASRRVTRQLAWDPTCLLLSPSFPMKNKQNLKVFKSRRQHNLFLENYPAFKGLNTIYWEVSSISHWLQVPFHLNLWSGLGLQCFKSAEEEFTLPAIVSKYLHLRYHKFDAFKF